MTDNELEKVVSAFRSEQKTQNRRWMIACLAVGLMVPGVMFAATINLTTFNSGEVASASQVNANFTALRVETERVSDALIGNIDGGVRLLNVLAPVADNDAATKAYVDAQLGSGGSSVTLIGTSTCPGLWQSAGTGRVYFSTPGSTPSFEPNYFCYIGQTCSSGNLGPYSCSPAPCVVCVK